MFILYLVLEDEGFEIRRYTNELEDIRNELGFQIFFEDIRMNWKIYE